MFFAGHAADLGARSVATPFTLGDLIADGDELPAASCRC
jgi:hypothetical protein